MKKLSFMLATALMIPALAACTEEEPTQAFDLKAQNEDWEAVYSISQEPSIGQKTHVLKLTYIGEGEAPETVKYEIASEDVKGEGHPVVKNTIKVSETCDECSLATEDDKTLKLTVGDQQETLTLTKQ